MADKQTSKSLDPQYRPEREILKDLEKICTSPGYAHVIAYFCWRDNFISLDNEVNPNDFVEKRSENLLIRSEISTLIGLMVKAPIHLSLPSPPTIQKLIDHTEKLLKELHKALNENLRQIAKIEKFDHHKENPFKNGSVLKEPIFYSAESAYDFQYREFAKEKYAKDKQWFEINKGFTPDQASQAINCIGKMQAEKLLALKYVLVHD